MQLLHGLTAVGVENPKPAPPSRDVLCQAPELRFRFISWGIDQLGQPALWGAKGAFRELRGKPVRPFDCSGLVTAGYHELGLEDWRATHNTDVLFARLEPTDHPLPGDLVFWRPKVPKDPGDVEHVGILLAGGHVLQAGGASSRIPTLEEAVRAGACVRVERSVSYRPGFAGYRRSPFT